MSETPVPEYLRQTMVDRVARAIVTHLAEHGRSVFWSELPPVWREIYRDQARAVIAAMREPTEPMIDKAWEMLVTSNLRHEEVYRYLIDAALTSPSPAEEG